MHFRPGRLVFITGWFTQRHRRHVSGSDAVFFVEELLEVCGKYCCEFLPGQKFEAGGEGGTVDGGEDREAGFDEVLAASIG